MASTTASPPRRSGPQIETAGGAGGGQRRRRADAERSIARILTAARAELGVTPGASVEEIARSAGVGRMTVYGHFPSRAAIVEAALSQALSDGEEILSNVDLRGDPVSAVERLLQASWELVAESVGLVAAAEEALPAERVRELHAAPADRLRGLIERGRTRGAFSSDLPVDWLISAVHMLVHGAAGEVRSGRLDRDDAPRVLSASVVALLVGADRTRPPQSASQ